MNLIPVWLRKQLSPIDLRELVSENNRLIKSFHAEWTLEKKKMDELIAAVTAQQTVIDSAVALCNGIADEIIKLKNGNGDPAAISALAQSVRARTAALSTAVAAGTAAESETPAPAATDPTATTT